MINDIQKASEVLKAIGHPIRLKIVIGLLGAEECNVNNIVSKLKLPQSTVSQHLGVLRNRGVIAARKDGVRTCYRIADKRMLKLVKVLAE